MPAAHRAPSEACPEVTLHGVGNLIPTRVRHGFPGTQWPKLLIEWLKTLPEH